MAVGEKCDNKSDIVSGDIEIRIKKLNVQRNKAVKLV